MTSVQRGVIKQIVGALATLAVLTGCGGGGAGGDSGCAIGDPSSLRVGVTFNGSAASVVTTLFGPSGEVLGARVTDRAAPVEATWNALGSGIHRLESVARSGPNGSGSVLGTLRAGVSVCRGTQIQVATGGAAANLAVSPNPVRLSENSTTELWSSARDTDGRFLFETVATPFTFTAQGPLTVAADGRVTPTAPGSGSVRVEHVPSGALQVVPVQVDPFIPRTGRWTILVFLNAANDLHPFSTLNVNQMERVASNPDVRFVLQWKQARSQYPNSSFDGTRRVLVRPDSSNAIASQVVQDLGGGVDMGRPETLREFIAWGKQNYPADRYGLVIWNHGNGWLRRATSPYPSRAVSYDDQTGNAIQIWELPPALAGRRFEFLAWDASLMQMMEVAYEVRSFANYVVGSQESPPGEGYPYDRILDNFRDQPSAPTETLLREFVDATVSYPPYATRKITQSVLRTDALNGLATAVDTLAGALLSDSVNVGPAVRDARAQAQAYSPQGFRVFRDLWGVSEVLRTHPSSSSAVRSAATGVQTALRAAVVHEGRNANSPGSRGLAVDFSSGMTFPAVGADYQNLALARDTRWDNWLLIAP